MHLPTVTFNCKTFVDQVATMPMKNKLFSQFYLYAITLLESLQIFQSITCSFPKQ